MLVLAAVGLHGWPGATDRHLAWTIQPELTPLAMGAGYASGIERRGSAYRIPVLSSLAGLVLLVGALVRGRDDLRDGAVASLYVVVAVGLTLLLALVLALLGRGGRRRT